MKIVQMHWLFIFFAIHCTELISNYFVSAFHFTGLAGNDFTDIRGQILELHSCTNIRSLRFTISCLCLQIAPSSSFLATKALNCSLQQMELLWMNWPTESWKFRTVILVSYGFLWGPCLNPRSQLLFPLPFQPSAANASNELISIQGGPTGVHG